MWVKVKNSTIRHFDGCMTGIGGIAASAEMLKQLQLEHESAAEGERKISDTDAVQTVMIMQWRWESDCVSEASTVASTRSANVGCPFGYDSAGATGPDGAKLLKQQSFTPRFQGATVSSCIVLSDSPQTDKEISPSSHGRSVSSTSMAVTQSEPAPAAEAHTAEAVPSHGVVLDSDDDEDEDETAVLIGAAPAASATTAERRVSTPGVVVVDEDEDDNHSTAMTADSSARPVLTSMNSKRVSISALVAEIPHEQEGHRMIEEDAKQSVSSFESKSSVTAVLRRSIERQESSLDPGLVKLKRSIMWIFMSIAMINIASTCVTRVLLQDFLEDVEVMRDASLRQRHVSNIGQGIALMRYVGGVRLHAVSMLLKAKLD